MRLRRGQDPLGARKLYHTTPPPRARLATHLASRRPRDGEDDRQRAAGLRCPMILLLGRCRDGMAGR
jgi:hypothetical protein